MGYTVVSELSVHKSASLLHFFNALTKACTLASGKTTTIYTGPRCATEYFTILPPCENTETWKPVVNHPSIADLLQTNCKSCASVTKRQERIKKIYIKMSTRVSCYKTYNPRAPSSGGLRQAISLKVKIRCSRKIYMATAPPGTEVTQVKTCICSVHTWTCFYRSIGKWGLVLLVSQL